MTMDENLREHLSGPVLTMQIIVFALTMGLLFFLAIVCFLTWGSMRGSPDAMPLLTFIGLGLAATLIAIRWIVLQVMTAGARHAILRGMSDSGRSGSSSDLPDHAAGQLLALYQTRMIVGAALLEGPAFFLLITYMLEHSPWSLLAAIVMILGVAAHFPTQDRVGGWVERQMSVLQEEQQLGPIRRE